MIPTLPYIEQKFDEFNQLMFEGKLPKLPIVLSNAKTFLGKCVCKQRKRKDGSLENYDFKLRINTRCDLPEQEVEDTIIHEMIHYYIGVNQLKDTSAHGPLFMQIMNAINEKFGRHITVSFKSSSEQKEQLADKRPRYHVIAVVKFHNGRTGIKVLPRIVDRILYYFNKVSAARDVESVKLYMSNNIFFNRFPNSSALNAVFLEERVITQQLVGAEKMECDGKKIIRGRRN